MVPHLYTYFTKFKFDYTLARDLEDRGHALPQERERRKNIYVQGGFLAP